MPASIREALWVGRVRHRRSYRPCGELAHTTFRGNVRPKRRHENSLSSVLLTGILPGLAGYFLSRTLCCWRYTKQAKVRIMRVYPAPGPSRQLCLASLPPMPARTTPRTRSRSRFAPCHRKANLLPAESFPIRLCPANEGNRNGTAPKHACCTGRLFPARLNPGPPRAESHGGSQGRQFRRPPCSGGIYPKRYTIRVP